ncbi:cytochrome b [Oricola thermophila]|uniref:Cytochrome b/b6 domain-containing protein n=1 Tax=Oricola thermophila TaxID=2742145 RepID=A0A6N1V9M3_9HYPH|nr:cytochrome b/b6 domain-containing protein [Oricola thermophila]QKV17646.1 cytochrome b/b6 domain-containing protein [Oricola thermophila]
MARQLFDIRDSQAGYCRTSIIVHWLTAIAVAFLYVSQEREWTALHLGAGLIVAPVFLFGACWRIRRGFPRVPDQPLALNLAERLVMIGILACLLAVAVTGILVPPLDGNALSIFGLLSLDVPLPADPVWSGIVKQIHATAGDAFIPLVGLHVLGALMHRFVWKDRVPARVIRPAPGGR